MCTNEIRNRRRPLFNSSPQMIRCSGNGISACRLPFSHAITPLHRLAEPVLLCANAIILGYGQVLCKYAVPFINFCQPLQASRPVLSFAMRLGERSTRNDGVQLAKNCLDKTLSPKAHRGSSERSTAPTCFMIENVFPFRIAVQRHLETIGVVPADLGFSKH